MTKRVPVKASIRKKKKGGVTTVKAHTSLKKDKKVKTAYSNDRYDVFNRGGKFHIFDKNTGKVVAISEKPSVVKEFVGATSLDEKSGKKVYDPNAFFGKKEFDLKQKLNKYKIRNPRKPGKSMRGKIENLNVAMNTGECRVGSQKGLPNRIANKLTEPKMRVIPRRLKKLGTPARRIDK